jgi:hypothetical protein
MFVFPSCTLPIASLVLFYKYAKSNQFGIERGELLLLLETHTIRDDAAADSDPLREREKLYTWTKKHFRMQERDGEGGISLEKTLDMISRHESLPRCIKLNVAQLVLLWSS